MRLSKTGSFSSSDPKTRRWWFYLILLFITSCLCLAIAESAVRIFWSPAHPPFPRIREFDPDVGLVHVPGKYRLPLRLCKWGRRCEDVSVQFTVNRQGLRGTHDFEEAAGRPLIAVIGDSFIEAAQVDDDKTACALLEKEFQGKFPNVEVRNFGMSGSGFVHYYARWKKFVASTKPDVLVVAVFGLNDFADTSTSIFTSPPLQPHYAVAENGNHEARFVPDPDDVDTLSDHSEVIRLVHWIKRIRKQMARARKGGTALPLPLMRIYKEPSDPDYVEAIILSQEYLRRLVREAGAAGAAVIVVYLPWSGEVLDAEWRQMVGEYDRIARPGARLMRERPEEIVRHTTQAEGVRFISFTAVAKGLPPDQQIGLWYVVTDRHLTEEGNRLLAKSLILPVSEALGSRRTASRNR